MYFKKNYMACLQFNLNNNNNNKTDAKVIDKIQFISHVDF